VGKEDTLVRTRRQKLLAAVALIAALVVTTTVGGCTPLNSSSKEHTTGSSSSTRSSGSSRSSAPAGGGVYHTVKKGETVWRISRTYEVGISEIVEANDLDDYTIVVGQRLFIPGASSVKAVPPRTPSTVHDEQLAERPDAKLSWPLVGRRRSSVTSGFGNRSDPVYGGNSFHKGVDIDGAREERVLAAAGGEIVFAGRMSGFGTVVMIDHGQRLITVYAHLSRAAVKLEDIVSRGQPIGYVGSSGKATGTHLHFEVRYKGKSVDPLDYLP
jgi:murein DD-endopeptidase MepM/ murein hydrolase activator NlpD